MRDRRSCELYKQFMVLAPLYPTKTVDEYRRVVRKYFAMNKMVPVGSVEYKRCLARGRYELKGVEVFIHVHKFRRMKKTYDWEVQNAPMQ